MLRGAELSGAIEEEEQVIKITTNDFLLALMLNMSDLKNFWMIVVKGIHLRYICFISMIFSQEWNNQPTDIGRLKRFF